MPPTNDVSVLAPSNGGSVSMRLAHANETRREHRNDPSTCAAAPVGVLNKGGGIVRRHLIKAGVSQSQRRDCAPKDAVIPKSIQYDFF